MHHSILLGIGTGRCGLASLARVLNRQTEAQSSFEEPPLLPWRHTDGQRVLGERFARFRREAEKGRKKAASPFRTLFARSFRTLLFARLGVVASFYLHYAECWEHRERRIR